jgi:hypothetical protein
MAVSAVSRELDSVDAEVSLTCCPLPVSGEIVSAFLASGACIPSIEQPENKKTINAINTEIKSSSHDLIDE